MTTKRHTRERGALSGEVCTLAPVPLASQVVSEHPLVFAVELDLFFRCYANLADLHEFGFRSVGYIQLAQAALAKQSRSSRDNPFGGSFPPHHSAFLLQ
jgi:hypothetical protein